MFFRLSEDEFKLFVQGLSIPSADVITVSFYTPAHLRGFIFLQPIINGRGPTREEVEAYADIIREGLSNQGMGRRVIISLSNLPVSERFGTERLSGSNSSLIKVQLL